jgi:hypothetical protein
MPHETTRENLNHPLALRFAPRSAARTKAERSEA